MRTVIYGMYGDTRLNLLVYKRKDGFKKYSIHRYKQLVVTKVIKNVYFDTIFKA